MGIDPHYDFHEPPYIARILLLGGCMVGPKYSKPAMPMAPAFKEAPPASFKEGDGWKTAQPDDQALRGDWWTMFQDAQLNALEAQVEAGEPDAAGGGCQLSRGSGGGDVRARGTEADHHHAPGIEAVARAIGQNHRWAGGSRRAGSFTLPLDFNWEIDLWGRLRRAVTAASEQAEASAADLENARLSLHAELAIDYFELRSADAQEKLLDETIKAYTRALQLTQDRYDGGAAPRSDVAQARTQLDTARVQRTDVEVETRAVRTCDRGADRASLHRS